MTTGGESENADFVGRNGKFSCSRANRANGSLGVAELGRMMVAWAKAIFEHERGDAGSVQPVGDLPTFMVGGKITVAAAWDNDDCGVRFVFRVRGVPGERGTVGVSVAQGAGRFAFPKRNGDKLR